MADQNITVDSNVELTSPVVWLREGMTQVTHLGSRTMKFVGTKAYFLAADSVGGLRWYEVKE